jgi:ketosteroid isomerase-like protein
MSTSRNGASSELVSMARGLYAAFGRGDISSILGVLDSEVEWGEPDNPFNPTAGTRYGREGVLEWLQIGNQAEEILALEPEQYLVGDETVAVTGHMKCRARATGKVYESEFVHLITITDGKVARFREFFDTYAAGEAYRAE